MNREMTLQAVVTETVLSDVKNGIARMELYTAGACPGVLFGGSTATRLDEMFKPRRKQAALLL